MSYRSDTSQQTSDSRLGRNLRRLGAAALLSVAASGGVATLAGAATPSPEDPGTNWEQPSWTVPVPTLPPYYGQI
ncbi:MAG: hypothetical protein ACR2OH_10095, partial [Microthrixaceae bacterium]